MKSTKPYQLFRKLNDTERLKMSEFLDCSVFNRREDVLILYQYLLKNYGRNIEKEDVWKAVYRNKPFQTTHWNLLCSRLFKCMESYLACRELLHDETTAKVQLSKAYRQLKMEKFFQSTIKGANQVLEKKGQRHAAYLYRRFELEQEYLDYVASHDRQARTNLQEASDALDAYFISSKLKQACFSLARKTINKEIYEIGLLQQVVEYVEANSSLLEEPAVALYFYCYKAIAEGGSIQDFLKLRQAIKDLSHFFPPVEIRDVYTVAINFCIRQLNTGQLEFVKEALELYRLSLDKGFLLKDGILPESTFSNIVALSLKLNDYRWTETFIEDYHIYLKPIFREPMQYFSLGRLKYEQGDLDKSMHFLARVDTSTSWLLLAAKTLQAKIYYELGETNVLDNLLDSMRVYLQRRNDLGYHSENYKNMVAFTRQLMSTSIKSKAEKEKFAKKVQSAKVFSEKDWFLKQIWERN